MHVYMCEYNEPSYTLTIYLQISAHEIVHQRFHDNHGIIMQMDRHHYPPCFRVRVNRQNSHSQLDINFKICVRSEEVVSTLNLIVPGKNLYSV